MNFVDSDDRITHVYVGGSARKLWKFFNKDNFNPVIGDQQQKNVIIMRFIVINNTDHGI